MAKRRNRRPHALELQALNGLGLPLTINWLEHNITRKALVLIDDARMHHSWASELATEVRLLRSDVPVIVVADDPDDTGNANEINETVGEIGDSGSSMSYAVEYRQVTFTSLIRSVEIAKLVAQFDRENQKRSVPREKDLVGQVVPFRAEGKQRAVLHHPKPGFRNICILMIGLILAVGMIGILVM